MAAAAGSVRSVADGANLWAIAGALLGLLLWSSGCDGRSELHDSRSVEPRFSFEPVWRGCTRNGPSALEGPSCGEPGFAPLASGRPETPAQKARWLVRLWAREDSLDRSLEFFEEALATRPGDSALWADFAAAQILAAQRSRDPRFLFRALVSAKRAIDFDPRSRAGRFNYALVVEHLLLREPARKAWSEYLSVDSQSAWAAEARARMERLSRPTTTEAWSEVPATTLTASAGPELASTYPYLIREAFERQWLPAWLRGRATLRDFLPLALAIERSSGDRFLTATLEHALAADGMNLENLKRGLELLQTGRDELRQRQAVRAKGLLESAVEHLGAADSPYQLLAKFRLARAHWDLKDRTRTLELAAGVAEDAGSLGFTSLFGLASVRLGLVHLEQGALQQALDRLEDARRAFEATGEARNLSTTLALVSLCQARLERPLEAWRSRYESLRLSFEFGDPAHFAHQAATAAREASLAGFHAAALPIQTEALKLDLESGDPLAVCEDYWYRGETWHRAGDDLAALRDLDLAVTWASKIPESKTREHMLAGIQVARGRALGTSQPAAAVESLSRAISYYRGAGFTYQMGETLLARAEAALNAHQLGRAEQDLEAAIATFEAGRLGLESPESRIQYFERAIEAFDEMIRFQLEVRQALDTALEYAERAKARALSEALNLPGGPLQATTGRGQALGNAAVLVLHSLEESTVAWLRIGDRMWTHTVRIGRDELEDQVEALVAAVRAGGSVRVSDLSRRLYELLLAPFDDSLAERRTLLVVPHRALGALPWAVLEDAAGERLVERLSVVVAPSLAVAELLSQDLPAIETWSVLALGAPAHDVSRFPHLPAVPATAVEARTVSGMWSGSELLLAAEATPSELLSRSSSHNLIHVAAHAIQEKGESWLVLAPDAAHGAGTLGAREIAGLKLPSTRLVVLPVCESARGTAYALEGTMALATAFLWAGVPNVVATLWPVEDRDTLAVMKSFYAELRAGRDPGEALRQAQLEAIRRDMNPATWAAFELFGALPQRGAR